VALVEELRRLALKVKLNRHNLVNIKESEVKDFNSLEKPTTFNEYVWDRKSR